MILKKYPKVLLGVTIHDSKKYIAKQFLDNIWNLEYPELDCLIVDNSKGTEFFNSLKTNCGNSFLKFLRNPVWFETSRQRQCYSLHTIRKFFLLGDYEYLFILESDLIPNSDIIEHLMSHNKDSVAAVYLIDKQKAITCLTKKEYIINNQTFPSVFVSHNFIDGELKQVPNGCGLGCVLIKKKVIEKIKFRYGENHSDTYFWHDVKSYGFEPYVDTSQIVRHYPSKHGKDF